MPVREQSARDQNMKSLPVESLIVLVAGISVPERSFEKKARIPVQIISMILEITNIHRDQCRAVCVPRYAQVAIDVVDRFFAVMKCMPQLRSVVPGGETINESGTYSSLEVTDRIIIRCLAILQHFRACEISLKVVSASGNARSRWQQHRADDRGLADSFTPALAAVNPGHELRSQGR